MTKLFITGVLVYDQEIMHSGDKDQEAKIWFMDILKNGVLTIVENGDMGDSIGTLKIGIVKPLSDDFNENLFLEVCNSGELDKYKPLGKEGRC